MNTEHIDIGLARYSDWAFTSSIIVLVAALLLLVFASAGARADDTEIFFNQNSSNATANVLLVLDTSGSMEEEINQVQNNINGSFTQIISANPAQINDMLDAAAYSDLIGA